MSIAAKVTLGSTLLLVLLAAVPAYQAALVRRTVAASRGLAANQLRASTLLPEQRRLLDEVEKHTRKLAATQDLDYAASREALRRELEKGLRSLLALDLSPAERERAMELAREWRAFWEAVPAPGQAVAPTREEEEAAILAVLGPHLASLRSRVDAVAEATQAAIAERLERADAERRWAARVSWAVVVAGAGLCALVAWMTTRSVSRPLKEITHATRAVAEGRFTYRLDASRNDEMSRLAAAFNSMVDQLGRLDQMKKDFVAHVSHELKNPLVAMQEANQLLAEGLAGPLTPRQQRLLDLNVRNGRRLSSMLSNLLDLSSLEAGAMTYDFRTVDLTDLAEFVLAECAVLARDKRLEMGLDLPAPGSRVWAPCDPDRMIQVLENLVENAIRYTPAGGTITLGVEPLEGPPGDLPMRLAGRFSAAAGSVVLLSVTDPGPGVADERKEAIFRKFHQVDRKPGSGGHGVGLGLAICREVVEAHQGAIWVEDAPGGGSRFCLLLRSAARERGAKTA